MTPTVAANMIMCLIALDVSIFVFSGSSRRSEQGDRAGRSKPGRPGGTPAPMAPAVHQLGGYSAHGCVQSVPPGANAPTYGALINELSIVVQSTLPAKVAAIVPAAGTRPVGGNVRPAMLRMLASAASLTPFDALRSFKCSVEE